jgi:hypothetical protein
MQDAVAGERSDEAISYLLRSWLEIASLRSQ